MWIAQFIGMGVVHTMRRGPLYRPAFERRSATENEKVLDNFRNLVATMRLESMITHPNSEASADPVKDHGSNHRRPTPEKEGRKGTGVKDHQESHRGPVYAVGLFSLYYFESHLTHSRSPILIVSVAPSAQPLPVLNLRF